MDPASSQVLIQQHSDSRSGNMIMSTSSPDDHSLKPTELKRIEADFENATASSLESKNYSIRICNNYKITICKALIPLKLTLFIYYGAGSFMTSFLTILYKQRGISLSELSTMTIISPVFQFLGTTLSGITADKLGRAKPVLIANLLIYLSVLTCILLLPNIKSNSIETRHMNITCHHDFVAQTDCQGIEQNIDVKYCQIFCLEQFSHKCSNANMDCKFFNNPNEEIKSPLSIHLNESSIRKGDDLCKYNVNSISFGNSTHLQCTENSQKYCMLSCTMKSKMNDLDTSGKLGTLLMGYVVLYVLFQTTYSNCYRCLDVTCMFLVKEHGSSFGHERFFAMLGNVLISPVAGYIADLTTPPGGERNYSAAFYLAIGMNMFLLLILCKLPVRVNAPGQKMWRKSLNLLRNIDAVMFLISIFVLGTAWNFGKYFLFWYLEEMKASSVLIGLITSVSALYGLPFLLTSHWWVKRIGSTRIFILALLGYAANSTGYYFLLNPWFSLLLEGTGIISYYLLWVAVIEYSHDIAPEGLRATVIATSGAIHFSIGKVSAGLMGGVLMDRYGGKAAFRFSAIFCLTTSILYGIYLCLKNIYTKKGHHIFSIEGPNEA